MEVPAVPVSRARQASVGHLDHWDPLVCLVIEAGLANRVSADLRDRLVYLVHAAHLEALVGDSIYSCPQ